MVQDLWGTSKPVIAMAHLGALPGAPGYDARGGIDALIAAALADVGKLQAGGVDAILFGNEGDRPYVLKAAPEGLAAMAAIVAAIKPTLNVPFGVDYLWDPYATVALAVATGAAFAREVFTGVYASDMGLWQPDGAGALRLRG
ncbi:MAG: sgcQ [Geminicoccaceae bacterium]|jgi:membrane complex biogenesis BtpA family protein|nr:sgcQ [Geminicoccaceae bacterium]